MLHDFEVMNEVEVYTYNSSKIEAFNNIGRSYL